MALQGWVSIYREVEEHWIWQEKPFSPGQAWVSIILLMNHKDKKFPFNGKLTMVKRGSKITSIRKLAERFGWSRSKVCKFLDMLEDDKMVVKNSDTKKTLLTVVNYDNYQKPKDTKETQLRHHPDTTETPTDTNNKDNNANNVKNGNKKIFIKPTISEIQDYCKERKNSVDAETFFHHYESNGWMVGKNKMKRWKSCVIKWEKSNNNNGKQSTNNSLTDRIEGFKSRINNE